MTINLTNVLAWVIFGLIVGAIANFIAPSSMLGLVGMVLLGIAGAVVGGYLGQVFFGVGITGFNVGSFALAVVGSLIVLFIAGLLAGR